MLHEPRSRSNGTPWATGQVAGPADNINCRSKFTVETGEVIPKLVMATSRTLDDPILMSTLGTDLQLLKDEGLSGGIQKVLICRAASSSAVSPLRALVDDVTIIDSLREFRRSVSRATTGPSASTVLYFRDVVDSFVCSVANPRLRAVNHRVHDIRGIPSLEMHLRERGHLRLMAMRLLEAHEWRRADRLKVVSSGASRFVQHAVTTPVSVIPNLPYRPDPPASRRNRIAYIGSDKEWQEVDATLELLSHLDATQDRHEVCVASQSPGLRSRATERGLSVYELSGVEEVGRFLDQTLAIVALRGEHPAVLTASPVKVAEALQHGCRVIGTSATGEWMPSLEASGLAYTVSLPFRPTELSGLSDFLRTASQPYMLPSDFELSFYKEDVVHYYLGGFN